MRLQLRPGLHQVWRRPGRLQIGLDPARGVVLDGLTAADEAVLSALRDGASRRSVVRAALAAGGSEAGALALLAEMQSAGVVAEGGPVRSVLARLPDDLRRRFGGDAVALGIAHPEREPWDLLEARRSRRVTVSGLGRSGLGVALALAAAGLGRLGLDDARTVLPLDELPGGYGAEHVGRRRDQAARDVLARACPETVAGPPARRPDLVVVIAHGALDATVVDGLMHEDVAHLAVLWGEAGVVVGPLVLPGRSSCLRCQHLHRTERDPEWPRVVAQVAGPGRNRPQQTEEASLVAVAAALATGQVLAHLDGAEPAVLNAALETSLPARGVALRGWPAHPRCGCLRLPGVAEWAQTGTMVR